MKNGRPDQLEILEKENELLREKEMAQKDLLSFISHTFRNALSNGQETVRQTLSLAEKAIENEYSEKLSYKAINNIAGLYSTFSMIDSLLDTFRMYGLHDEEFMEEWSKNFDGETDVNYLFAYALRQNSARLLFSDEFREERYRLFNTEDTEIIRTKRKKFLLEVLSLDLKKENAKIILNWFSENAPFVELKIHDNVTSFNTRKFHYNLIFSIITETMFNAFKYSDGTVPVKISWKRERNKIEYSCRNQFSAESIRYSDTKSGLRFIEYLVRILKNVKFVRTRKNSVSTAGLSIELLPSQSGGIE